MVLCIACTLDKNVVWVRVCWIHLGAISHILVLSSTCTNSTCKIIGVSLSEPHIDEFPMNFHSIFYICHTSCHKSLLALSCLLLRLSLIQKLFTNYLARRCELSTSLMVKARTETTHGSTYSMARAIGHHYTGYCMAKTFSSVDAIICVATHSGSHSSHGPTSPMATLMRAIACHKR